MRGCLVGVCAGVSTAALLRPHLHAANVHSTGTFLYTGRAALRSICLFWCVFLAVQVHCLWDLLAFELTYSEHYYGLGYVMRGQFLTSQYYTFLIYLTAAYSLPAVQTTCNFYFSANWLEREVWDFFGIYFYEHPNLRRIFNDYYFYGFPLRRAYTLGGLTETTFDFRKRQVGNRSRLGRAAKYAV